MQVLNHHSIFLVWRNKISEEKRATEFEIERQKEIENIQNEYEMSLKNCDGDAIVSGVNI